LDMMKLHQQHSQLLKLEMNADSIRIGF
jgi:hypothetical protein